MKQEDFRSRTKERLVIIIIAVLFFGAGGLIYILYRAPTLHMFSWFRSIGIHQYVLQLRELEFPIIPEWIKFCLPDGLWMASYMLLMVAIWLHEQTRRSLVLSLLLPIFINASEILQFFHLTKGTFDPIDLLCYDIPVTIYIIHYYYEKKNSTFSVRPDNRSVSVFSERLG